MNKKSKVVKRKKIIAADLFCGAGGTSTGLALACKEMGFDLDLVAVNHWDVAISTHTKNHPGAKHFNSAINDVDLLEAVPGGRLHLLVASPECTHFSNARGGKPMSDQKRATPLDILRWLKHIKVDNVLIENVREFQNWGPLDENGRPVKELKGEKFREFIAAIKALGYNVEYRVLNAADYGDPTSRQRLFIIARRGKKKIIWPEPSHSKTGAEGKPRWKAARGVIDWSLEGKSIFNRKKPLAPATLKRIEAGLRKFGGPNAEPFIIMLRKHGGAISLDGFIVPQFSEGQPKSVEDPLGTLTTTSRGVGLCEAFMVPFFGEGENQKPRTHSVDAPMPTVTPNAPGLVEPIIMCVDHGSSDGNPRPVDDPLPTVTGKERLGVIEPYVMRACHPNDMSTWPVDEPLRTLTTKEQLGLVETDRYTLDIRFRMLQPHELAAAMSFPEEYEFTGNREKVVKQIGNAVPGGVSKALCAQLLKAA